MESQGHGTLRLQGLYNVVAKPHSRHPGFSRFLVEFDVAPAVDAAAAAHRVSTWLYGRDDGTSLCQPGGLSWKKVRCKASNVETRCITLPASLRFAYSVTALLRL